MKAGKEGRAQFLKKMEACGNDEKALLSLGKSCFLAECYHEAIEAYRKCLSLNSRSDAASYNLGVAYQALGKYRDARRALLKALELNPNHKAAQQALNSISAM